MATTRDASLAAAMPLRSLVEERRTEIRRLVAQHGGQRVRLFGSVARGQEHAGSDIDLLVDFGPGSSLFDLLHLSQELEALLGHRVDVVSRGGLKARDTAILDEAVDL
jgi:predicted nucleotidyltransferase